MTVAMPVNAADLTAAAFGRRKPKFPVVTETLGLALVLLVNRNTARDRAVWLAHPVVSDVLCDCAEAFAEKLTGKPSPDGWRGGAVGSLRTLAGQAMMETSEPWPWPRGGADPSPVVRFWLDDELPDMWPRPEMSAVRAELLGRLRGQDGLEDAWQALLTAFRGMQRYGMLAGFSSAHESPVRTKWLHSELFGRDPGADVDARIQARRDRGKAKDAES